METIDRIPTSKIERATKIVKTGAKVGVNYAKYVGNKLVTTKEEAKKKLDADNADDIYDSLKQLKGGALKVAQMLSMEKNVLPEAYVDKFSLAQFSVPPLSPALVVKTFKQYFGKAPIELFDAFSSRSVNAASIGQVHKAKKDGKELAVKIQYPGVAESISSDLAMVKPIAMRMFNIKGKDSDQYFEEIRDKLIEETDYENEVAQSKSISEACAHLDNLVFPKYYDEYSSDRIITMDWMTGQHLSEFTSGEIDQEIADKVGQSLWDFYMYQIHKLRKVHADPHPGNFLIKRNGELVVLDFGCVKELPDSFYTPYFEMTSDEVFNDPVKFKDKLFELEILRPEDSNKEETFFTEMFHELLSMFTAPLKNDTFDFDDKEFFAKIASLGEQYARSSEIRKMNGNRRSRHFIYMNRTFFGLYHLMFDLGARNVKVKNFEA